MVSVAGGRGTAKHAVRLEGFSRASAWVVLVLACVVVAGWALDIRTLTSVVPGYNTMKVNTALCLAALAAAVLARRRAVVLSLCLFVGALTGATLVEIATDRSFHIDELLFSDRGTTGGAAPGRMAPATGFALLSMALAIAALPRGRGRPSQLIVLLPGTIAVTALLGYLYDVEQLYKVASLSSVALHTALALLLLALAVAALVPGGVLAWAAAGRGPGSVIFRQTAPIIVFGLVTLGEIRKRLGDAGSFGEHFGIALMVMVGVVIAVGTTAFAARRLDVADEGRVAAEDSLRELNLSLQEGRDAAWARAERLAVELARERERFDLAVASTESIIWTVETTNGQQVAVYASPNVERVLGARLLPGETATAALTRLVDEDQSDAALEFQRCVGEGIPAEAELRLTVDGLPKWVRVHGTPRTEDVRTFYDGITIDVTDQRQVAEQRELLLVQGRLQVERLSELNRVRDEFIAVAGHELRTPVAVILGYLELVNDPHATEQSRAESLEVITRRAQQLSDLVERVFDLAKIDSGAMDLNLETISTREFITDLVNEHQNAAAAASVELAVEAEATTVIADGPRLQQVFDNLLANAVKYTPAGGHVRLAVKEQGADVVFEVADDGIGVSDDDLPRLFDRLFRAASAREARIPGTGLGLAVTRALVEAHGGTITVRKNDPHGVVFRVTLPRTTAGAEKVAAR